MIRRSFSKKFFIGKASPAFTLIELLVVIAILAVLAVVVVLTLNPAGLLQESRDSNRLQDMSTLTSAISYSLADNGAESLGSPNTVYVSVADPTATSTAGDQCQGVGLPLLPSLYSYHCAASSTWRKTDGTGWIPVSLSNNTFGSSLSQLPVDPVNVTSSRLYYSYATDANGKFEVTTPFESAKYKLGGANDQVSGDGGTLATVYEKGSKLGLEPLDYGDASLIALWTLNEGTNTIAYDYSGKNATGSWTGTQAGTSGYYGSGKGNGFQYAGNFDGGTDSVYAGTPSVLNLTGSFTFSAWINVPSIAGYTGFLGNGAYNTSGIIFGLYGAPSLYLATNQAGGHTIIGGGIPPVNQWVQIVATFDGTMGAIYMNGVSTGSGVLSPPAPGAQGFEIGWVPPINSWSRTIGLMNDVRIYNRALSAAEIAAMYNGGK